MSKLLERWLGKWKKVAGVELVLLAEGQQWHACILEEKKGKIQLLKKSTALSSIEEVKAFLDEDVPIALSVSGRGVLHKRLEKVAEVEPSKLLGQAIPNAKASDFYLQTYSNTFYTFISIVRKPLVEETIQQFATLSLPLVAVSFGGMAFVSVFPLVEETGPIQLGEHLFERKKGELEKYGSGQITSSPTTTVIGGESLPSLQTVAYSTAFQQFLPSSIEAEIPTVSAAKEEYIQKQVFTKLGWGVLCFFLVILMANYLVFSQLSKETERLSMATGLQKSQLEQLNRLKKEVGEKEKFFQNEGWMQSSRASFYADRIAETVPESMLLTSLDINPLDQKSSREARKKLFEDGLIVITGHCKRPIDLNGWIKRLKDFPWAQKVDVENYAYDSADKIGKFRVEMHFE